METEVYARHSLTCPHRENREYRKCRCRKWIYFIGTRKRVSAGTRSWEAAELRAKQLLGGDSSRGGQSIAESVRLFIEDKQIQGGSKNWTDKFKRDLNPLVAFCALQPVTTVSDITLHHLEQFRKTWTGKGSTRSRRQARLRMFFLYCCKHKWCRENVAADLSRIKVEPTETLPLSQEEFAATLNAANEYHPRGTDKKWRRSRALAMLLLCRHSGLRISDAARLERSRLLDNDALLLRTTKTGQPVYVPLPPHVAKLMRELTNDNPQYFFWNGTSDRKTPGVHWWGTLTKIFTRAGIPDAHPHCLRDTFAVECLLGGVPLKDVSVMLGHSSTATTEKHYLAWVLARQTHLEDVMKKVWEKTGALDSIMPSCKKSTRRTKPPGRRSSKKNAADSK